MAQCHKRAFVNHPTGLLIHRLIHMDRAPELIRSWSENRPAQVSPLGQAGRIQPPDRSQRSSAHAVHFYRRRLQG